MRIGTKTVPNLTLQFLHPAYPTLREAAAFPQRPYASRGRRASPDEVGPQTMALGFRSSGSDCWIYRTMLDIPKKGHESTKETKTRSHSRKNLSVSCWIARGMSAMILAIKLALYCTCDSFSRATRMDWATASAGVKRKCSRAPLSAAWARAGSMGN